MIYSKLRNADLLIAFFDIHDIHAWRIVPFQPPTVNTIAVHKIFFRLRRLRTARIVSLQSIILEECTMQVGVTFLLIPASNRASRPAEENATSA